MRENMTTASGFFAISVAARMLGVHAQTLRAYERQGLIVPSRTKGRIRLYSLDDIRRAQQVRRLVEDLGVNLAGVEVILRLTERIRSLERQIEQLQQIANSRNERSTPRSSR
jgi:MerR family transcriptional regulator, heat shock protein HspR